MAGHDQENSNSLLIDLGGGEGIQIDIVRDKTGPLRCSVSSSVEQSGMALPILMESIEAEPKVLADVLSKIMVDHTSDGFLGNLSGDRVSDDDARAVRAVFVQKMNDSEASDLDRALYARTLLEWSEAVKIVQANDIRGYNLNAVCTDEDKQKAVEVLDELFAPYAQQIASDIEAEQDTDSSSVGDVTQEPVVTEEQKNLKEPEKVAGGVEASSVEVKPSIPFSQETLEVQALLRLGAGIDPKLIDGKNGPLTKAVIVEYAKANGLSENISVHDLHNHLLVRFGEDADFRSLVRLNAVSAIDDGSRDGVKAAQVVLNLEGIRGLNDKPLKIDGVAGENTSAARVVLEGKIKATGAEKQAAFEQKKFMETTIAEFKKNIEDLTAPENQARRIAGLVNALAIDGIGDKVLDKRGTKLIAAAFNEVAPGVLDEETLTRRTGHLIEQYEDVTAYNKYDRGAAYVPAAGDVIFYKDGTAAIVDGVSNVNGQDFIHVIGGEVKDGERFVMTYPADVFANPDDHDSKFNYKAPTDFYGHDYGEIYKHPIRGIGSTQELLSKRGVDGDPKQAEEAPAVDKVGTEGGSDRILPRQMVEPPKL